MYRADNWVALKDITPQPKDYEGERALGWAAGTLEVLRYVSSLGLDRYTGWRCPEKPRFIDAGRVYKRGVAINHVKELPSPLPTVRYGVIEDPNHLVQYFSEGQFVIFDVNILPSLSAFSKNGVNTKVSDNPMFIEGASEKLKNLGAVAHMLNRWREGNGRMKWTVIGGGVLSDVCAFAASCVGARIDLLPTTLLAMVDAAIGGKTGVNSEFGKNQIGSYYFPDNVFICPYWVAGLPRGEIFAGSWECIKLALLVGDLQLVEQWLGKIYTDPNHDWVKLIKSTADIKATLVRLDPFEINGHRQLLNLGHTLAHALEAIALNNDSDELRHGEAVGVGLIYVLLLSRKLGKLSTADDLLSKLTSHRGLLSKQQLAEKIKVDNLDKLWPRLLPIIDNDKKRRNNKVPWVVLQDQRNDDGFYAELTVVDDQQLLLDCWQQLLVTLP